MHSSLRSGRVLCLACLLWLSAGSHRAAMAQERSGDQPAEAEVATAPVVIDGVELFRVRGVSSYPAPARARLIQSQIARVAADRSVAPEALRTVEINTATRIMAGNEAIMVLLDADAQLEQVARSELAVAHLRRIQQAIASYRDARTSAALRRGLGRSLVATLLVLLALIALRMFWRWLDRTIRARLQPGLQAVEAKSYALLRAAHLWAALHNAILALRVIAGTAAVLVYLGFVLAQFPWTRPLSLNVAALVLDPLALMGAGFVAHIPSLVFLAVLFVLVRVALRFIRLFFAAVGRGVMRIEGFDADWAVPTYKLVRLAMIAFALIVAYPYIPGSSTAAFQGVSLFVGIVFSLGSTAAISNIVAGYMMTYRRALKVGDRVRIGDALGDVIETRLQVTHLRSLKNEEIIIPNSQIMANDVLNYSSLARTTGLILHTEVGIGYETPWRQVEAMLIEAAGRTDGLSNDGPPFVLQKKLGDFAVTYEINVYTRDIKAMAVVYTDLHRHILDVFNEYGVQIMTPAYEGDPEQPKVVAPKDWHAAPAAQRPERA
jgi:small-conductance mechanosensitive channel